MPYQNTGFARNQKLTVTKGDQTHDYYITEGFEAPSGTTYGPVTQEALARLTEAEYERRLNDFCNHVYEQEDGLRADCPNLAHGAVEYNTTLCPLPIRTEQ